MARTMGHLPRMKVYEGMHVNYMPTLNGESRRYCLLSFIQFAVIDVLHSASNDLTRCRFPYHP